MCIMGYSDENMKEVRSRIDGRERRKDILRILLKMSPYPALILVLWFLYAGISLYVRNHKSLSWEATPCTIKALEWYPGAKEDSFGLWTTASSIFDMDSPNHYEIHYCYTLSDNAYASTRYSIPRHYRADPNEHYPSGCRTGKETVCYVNPKNPAQSVLECSSLSLKDFSLNLISPFLILFLYGWVPPLMYIQYKDDIKKIEMMEESLLMYENMVVDDPVLRERVRLVLKGVPWDKIP